MHPEVKSSRKYSFSTSTRPELQREVQQLLEPNQGREPEVEWEQEWKATDPVLQPLSKRLPPRLQ